MGNKLKELEIKKLIQEYNFLLTDDEYKKEIIQENRPVFMEKVDNTKKKLDIKQNIEKINELNQKQEIEKKEIEFTIEQIRSYKEIFDNLFKQIL